VVLGTSRVSRVGAYLLSAGGVVLCSWLLSQVSVNAGAAAPVLLLSVLLIARAFGTGPALAGAVAAALAFSFYFLPPFGLAIDSIDDWVAFGTFSIAAVVVGELAARAERRQALLEVGKREIEQLYEQLGAAFERASEAEAGRRNEQLKAALLDALTHNLRTPLTAIKASVTALLRSGEADSLSRLSLDSRRDLLAVIDEESDRLNLFIEGLAVVDRPDPLQAHSSSVVPVDQIVRETVARAETVARRHRVVVTVSPELPALAVERAAIGEALYTLIDNASKYSPVNSTIRVRAGEADEHHVRIVVEDEGPGIPMELREQVFQKFFRIPGRESVDPRRTGIGLGLPIARRLVESQAGQIVIDTPASGRGTAVVLTLPCVTRTSSRASVEALAALQS
jgi:two-component system sensor histidine kinase KdpD